MRPIDNENFSVIVYDKDGKTVRINPCEGFDMVLDFNGYSRKLLNCKCTMSMANELVEPHQVYSITSMAPVYTIPKSTCPNYTFDVYPSYFIDGYEECEEKKESKFKRNPVKETDNITVEEKLKSNIIY